MGKLSAAAFAAFLMARAAKKDGYIMGSRGQDPKKLGLNSWWFKQYSGSQRRKALYWREHAERVWDCQGMSEGYINDMTGSNIDVRARNNYSSWCDPKGKGTIPKEYRVPGAAVFKAYDSGTIHHVGYLVAPVKRDNPEGDWYIVEAKGVMYGVITTKLSDGGWNRWGLMTKYFDYEDAEPIPEPEFGDRTLDKGTTGADVKELQSMLIELGFSCGTWGADGDFGVDTENAVKAFQSAYRLPVDGIVDDDDFAALKDGALPDDPDEPEASYIVDALDISSYNSSKFPEIDWQKVADNIAFLILRCGCTRTKTKPLGIGGDNYFDRFAEKCMEYGIPFWVYYYSKAKSVEFAQDEAEFAFNAAAKYNPVGYCIDCEEGILNAKRITAWLDAIRALGAKRTMAYIGHNWYRVYNLPVDSDGFVEAVDAVWIPRYGKNDGTFKEKYTPAYPCDLHQFTSVYAFKGIPDKTLDANRVTGQRRSIAWFRGEE